MIDKEQALERKNGIGGSDIPVLIGASDYSSPLQIYVDKVSDDPIEWFNDDWLDIGNRMEQLLADKFAERHEVQLRRMNQTLRHKEIPYFMGHVDRVLALPEGFFVEGWEAKNVDRSKAYQWGKTGSEEVSDHCFAQVQWYMGVKGWKRFWVSALIGGNDYREYIVDRDDAFIKNEQDIATKFWTEHVTVRVPPPITENVTPDLIKKIYPGTNGQEITLPLIADSWSEVRLEAMAHIARYTQVKDTAESEILMALKDNAIGRLSDGKGRFERKLVKKEAYAVPPSQYLQLRYVRPTTKKGKQDDQSE